MKWKGPATAALLSAALLAVAAIALHLHARTTSLIPRPTPAAFPQSMPDTILWAWETPQDLTTLDPTHTGVAYLAESLTLSDTVARRPRFQPLRLAPNTAVMAVVRIQPTPGFKDTSALRAATVEALAKVAAQPNTRAFQIDFDATRSQRDFYAAILQQLRPKLPAAMPLSITALVSWCGSDRAAAAWLSTLPIDEAVPMYFRLGGSSQPTAIKPTYPITQPLCRSSIGVSTDETWPTLPQNSRIYLFSPHAWSPTQLATINQTPATALQQELLP
jgi:hypothetical protein